jgi:3-hydroxymyristoyl/3-hydroxydecanoyl-(acyl carrier protein) dehydratase
MGSEIQRQIRRDHPALAGHFPGNPLVPGVLLLTELLGILEQEAGRERGPVTLTSVKFMRLLRPGEPFTVRWQILPEQDIAFAVALADETIAAGTVRWASALTKQVGS